MSVSIRLVGGLLFVSSLLVLSPEALAQASCSPSNCTCDIAGINTIFDLNTHGYTVNYFVDVTPSDGCCYAQGCTGRACKYDYNSDIEVVVSDEPVGAPEIVNHNYQTGTGGFHGWSEEDTENDEGHAVEFAPNPDPHEFSCNVLDELLWEVHFGDGTVPRIKIRYMGACQNCEAVTAPPGG